MDPFSVARQSEPVDPSTRSRTIGFADRVDDDIVGVFARDRRAFVFVNDHCWDVQADDIRTQYRRLPFLEIFRLTRKGQPVYRKVRGNWKRFRESVSDPTVDRIDDLQAYVLDAIATLLSDPRRVGEWAERISRKET